jgi:hypothetical protein
MANAAVNTAPMVAIAPTCDSMNDELRATSYELRATSYELRATSYELQKPSPTSDATRNTQHAGTSDVRRNTWEGHDEVLLRQLDARMKTCELQPLRASRYAARRICNPALAPGGVCSGPVDHGEPVSGGSPKSARIERR